MARQPLPLNNTKISQAKPKLKDYTLSDGDGLYLLVKSNGSKLWRFNYYDLNKKRRLVSFGAYPEMGLAEARAKRAEYRELVAQGIEPQEHFFKQKTQMLLDKANTLLAVAEDWRTVKSTKVAEKTMSDQWRRLDKYVFPHLGQIPVGEITAPLARLKLQHLAQARKFEMLIKVVRGLNEIMRFAVNAGLIKYNPLADIREVFPSRGMVKHLPAVTPSELPKLLNDVANGAMTLQTRYLFTWQLLTMVRPSEAAGTRWAEIDFENRVWNIPAERMKGKTGKKRPHFVPLSSQALKLLESIRPLTGCREYVFPKNGYFREPMSSESVNRALNRLGYAGKQCSHGLRSIASTAMNENEFNVEVVESLLSHIKGDQTRIAYDRSQYEKQRREYLEWWGNLVENSVDSPELLGL